VKWYIQTLALAALIHLPIVAWLQPPWYAVFALGVAAACIARASL
jgi:hypothetical protein